MLGSLGIKFCKTFLVQNCSVFLWTKLLKAFEYGSHVTYFKKNMSQTAFYFENRSYQTKTGKNLINFNIFSFYIPLTKKWKPFVEFRFSNGRSYL